jgi:hypothetical protein
MRIDRSADHPSVIMHATKGPCSIRDAAWAAARNGAAINDKHLRRLPGK